MNVSKIVKDNQELLNNNNYFNKNINNNNEMKQRNLRENNNIEQKREFDRAIKVSLNSSNFAQIDEDELLTLITNGVCCS